MFRNEFVKNLYIMYFAISNFDAGYVLQLVGVEEEQED